MKKSKICVICDGTIDEEDYGEGEDGIRRIWDGGHNPWPIKDNGRCCTDCNLFVVVPARMKHHYARRENDG